MFSYRPFQIPCREGRALPGYRLQHRDGIAVLDSGEARDLVEQARAVAEAQSSAGLFDRGQAPGVDISETLADLGGCVPEDALAEGMHAAGLIDRDVVAPLAPGKSEALFGQGRRETSPAI